MDKQTQSLQTNRARLIQKSLQRKTPGESVQNSIRSIQNRSSRTSLVKPEVLERNSSNLPRSQTAKEAFSILREAQERSEKRNRIQFSDVFLMVGTAMFFDFLQAEILAIPIAGTAMSVVFSIFAWLTFYMWTSIKGWGLSDTIKRIIVTKILPIIEFIPLVNIIPAWTLSVSLQLFFLKAEDAAYNLSRGKLDAQRIEKIGKMLKL